MVKNTTIFWFFVLAIVFGTLGASISKWFHFGTMFFLGLGLYACYYKLIGQKNNKR